MSTPDHTGLVGRVITEKAKQLALQDQTAQELGRAITKAVNALSADTYEVVADFAEDCYFINIEPAGATRPAFVVRQETLERHTTDAATFRAWIRRVARPLCSVMGTLVPQQVASGPGWDHEFVLVPIEPTKAMAQLEELGFQHKDDYDYDQAIASLMHSLQPRER